MHILYMLVYITEKVLCSTVKLVKALELLLLI